MGKSLRYPILIAAVIVAAQRSFSDRQAELPTWIETDSIQAIQSRIESDFSLSIEDGAKQIIARHPQLTIDSIREFAKKGYVELMTIDGHERMHRKSPKNVELLNPAYNHNWQRRGGDASAARISYADSIIRWSQGNLPDGGAHRLKVKFTIDVPYNEALEGDTLRVWMPYPMEADRQRNVKLISTEPQHYIASSPEQSLHSTLYFEQPVKTGEDAHFEYIAEFDALGAYFSPQEILQRIRPYDKDSDLYVQFTAFDNPHIVRLDSLAQSIVGDESNPYLQSELVYDYIINRYPWAGAREYSTIPCLPQYVVDQGHGDCGQVSLLYISLMRSLGVPARWESGWMLHPGEKNLHDWAETYYEGIGWVPVDVSFGRYTTSDNKEITDFYSTGIDSYRLIANKGVSGQFDPPKAYVRSETVDSQVGEVECSIGNLFYPGWDYHLEILDRQPISIPSAH